MSSKEIVVIDTDCGVDDALAILLALSHENCVIPAITCVAGNTHVNNAANNVLRVLEQAKADEIPVYRGCAKPLVRGSGGKLDVRFHGDDGLGGASHLFPVGSRCLAEDRAANIMTYLGKMHAKQLNLVAIGPLTNVALAHRLDPDFTANLKSLVIMGGNFEVLKNKGSPVEFNFRSDPEAAYILLEEAKCPITMVPYDTLKSNAMPYDIYERIIQENNTVSNFIKQITQQRLEYSKQRGDPGFFDCDFLAMAALLYPRSIRSVDNSYLTVELDGKYTKGLALYQDINPEDTRRPLVKIIKEFNDNVLNDKRLSLARM